MLVIRLQRTGRKNEPSFRVVLVDSRHAAKSGKFQEILGSYDVKTGAVALKEARVAHWVAHGAKPSDTMHNILVAKSLVKGSKKNVLSKKSPTKKKKEK